MPAKDVTVTAQFEDVPPVTYTVSFDKNGGGTEALLTSTTVQVGKTVGTLPSAPERASYSFAGWNTAPAVGGSAFTGETLVTASITIYAQWSPLPGIVTSNGNEITITTADGSKSVKGNLTTKDNTLKVIVKGDAFSELASSDKNVKIDMASSSMTFDDKAMDAVSLKAESNDVVLTVSLLDAQTLSETEKSEVGNRPVYNFSVTSGGKVRGQVITMLL